MHSVHVTETPLARRKRRDPNTRVQNSNSCSEMSLEHSGRGEGLLTVRRIGGFRPLRISPPSEDRARVAQPRRRQPSGGRFSEEGKQARGGRPGPGSTQALGARDSRRVSAGGPCPLPPAPTEPSTKPPAPWRDHLGNRPTNPRAGSQTPGRLPTLRFGVWAPRRISASLSMALTLRVLGRDSEHGGAEVALALTTDPRTTRKH